MLGKTEKTKSPTKPIDGIAWITGGNVYVKNESFNGTPALINPCDKVKLLINRNEYSYLTSVHENDSIEIISKVTEQKLIVNVSVDEDKMNAFIDYFPPGRVLWKVQDTESANKIDIQVEQFYLEFYPVKKIELLDVLKNNDVVYGILDNALQEIINNNKPGKFLVAQGIRHRESENERIEYFFEDDPDKKVFYSTDERDRADYKNIVNYKIVQENEKIAQIHPAKEGEPGKDVFGTVISPSEPKYISITPSNSIYVDEETKTVYSKKSGRTTKVVKNNSILFNIIESLTVDEVSIKTGNIRYTGDVEVLNNVCETMDIVTKHNVKVNGNVSFANIISGNNITIGGSLISSKIYAGSKELLGKNPTSELNKIVNELNSLIDNLKNFPDNLAKELGLSSFWDKINYLLNSKNKTLTSVIYSVIRNFKKERYNISNEEKLIIIKKSSNVLCNLGQIKNLEYLYDIVNSINLMCDLKEDETNSGNVEAGYILSSEIHALGDVKVSGKGCINSTISTNGNVYIDSVFRGGEITAGGNITIRTLGSELGIKTMVSTLSSGIIEIDTAYQDSVIKIGCFKHKFLDKQKFVSAKLVNDKIVFKT
jgi:uncharacterized protein